MHHHIRFLMPFISRTWSALFGSFYASLPIIFFVFLRQGHQGSSTMRGSAPPYTLFHIHAGMANICLPSPSPSCTVIRPLDRHTHRPPNQTVISIISTYNWPRTRSQHLRAHLEMDSGNPLEHTHTHTISITIAIIIAFSENLWESSHCTRTTYTGNFVKDLIEI
ncbi:hypothetical protein F4779DRAFT_435231 [Xylariaceae sp. FL0662B]|nr:hypothetical protein F4779DRAFT_435231 [Xylariaceae sp. FL0662B]